MQIASFRHERSSGDWSESAMPELDSENTLVLAFGATEYLDDPSALKELCAKFPKACVPGCSTSGEIFGDEIFDDSLSVAVAKFDSTKLRSASAAIASAADSREAGRKIGEELMADDLRAVLVISDGLQVNGSELVRGLNEVLPESCLVTGGLAGDRERFERTWVLSEGEPRAGMVTAVGFYGDKVRFGHGSKGGWDMFGPERVVTRSEGNVLFELDGKPALSLYKEYLGDRVSGLPATALLFPLALRSSRDDEQRLERTILSVDEDKQSMTFAGDLPEGHLAQLMRANFDRLVDGAADASVATRTSLGEVENALCIAVSCVGRRLVLGERTEEEVEAVKDALPKNTQQVGFYSYGEISPYASGRCDLHNQTMTLTAIGEVS